MLAKAKTCTETTTKTDSLSNTKTDSLSKTKTETETETSTHIEDGRACNTPYPYPHGPTEHGDATVTAKSVKAADTTSAAATAAAIATRATTTITSTAAAAAVVAGFGSTAAAVCNLGGFRREKEGCLLDWSSLPSELDPVAGNPSDGKGKLCDAEGESVVGRTRDTTALALLKYNY
jgi:hypothetical protein